MKGAVILFFSIVAVVGAERISNAVLKHRSKARLRSSTSVHRKDYEKQIIQNGSKAWYLIPEPTLSEAPPTPFFPLSVGCHGSSLAACEIDLVSSAVTIVREIAKDTDSGDVTGEYTLSKFNNLIHLLKTFSDEQMENATAQLYVKLRAEEDTEKYLGWVVYRDAVVQSGTGPSIISLSRWIRDELVSGEEAAQLVSTVTNTAEYPTEKFIKVFFEIVKTSDTLEQPCLNSSAILAFSSLIKKAYVCDKSMNLRYPIHVYRQSVSKNSKALEYVYLPYLVNKFRQAIDDGDSHKIQVFTRALGNTAHPKVLDIFRPYLSGHERVSDYQKLLMVASLDSLTIVNPEPTRKVLYQIYLNSEVTPEIRSAAVSLIMRTNPKPTMLQRMAEATNWDSSDHVNSAVKSAIESAAMNQPENELSSNAKEALNYLTTKFYGHDYSTNLIKTASNDNNLGYSLRISQIQSTGTIIPSSLSLVLRPVLGGFSQRAYKFSWMTSSMDNLLTLLKEQIKNQNDYNIQKLKQNFLTLVNVNKILGIEKKEKEQVEGSIYYTLHSARRFISFDDHVIKELPKLAKFASSAFRIGDNFNYTKYYNQFSIRLAFPTALGMPFVFTLEAPTVFSFVGHLRINTHPDLANGSQEKVILPKFLNLTSKFQAMFSSKTESKLGFVAPFNRQFYLAGYDTNILINLPLKIKFEADIENNKFWTKLQPLNPSNYQKIFEFSSLAFTTKHDILTLNPPQLDKNAEIIRVGPLKKFFVTRGQGMTGFAFDIKSQSRSTGNVPFLLKALKNQDLLSALMYFDKNPTIEPYSKFEIYYNPNRTMAKSAQFTFKYADVKVFAESEENDDPTKNMAVPSVGATEHKKRVEQFLKRSTSGMRDSYAQCVDLSAEFEGVNNRLVTATAAFGRSYISQKARFLLYIRKDPEVKSPNTKPLKLSFDARLKLPNVPLGNFREAIKSDLSSSISVRLNIWEELSNSAEVVLNGHLEKSPDRVNYLLSLPITRECEKEMDKNNYLLHSCHDVTARASIMDQLNFKIMYRNVPNYWKKKAYNLYSSVRHITFPYVTENAVSQTNTPERLEIDAVFSPEFNSLNATLIAPSFSSSFSDVRISKYLQPASIVHPHYTIWDRMYERLFFIRNTPRCVIDDSYAITFDNTSYPVVIGECWQVLLHFKPPDRSGSVHEEDVSILLRGMEQKTRELTILLGENIVKLHSNNGTPTDYFTVNEERYDTTQGIVGHFERKTGETVIQAYKLSTGAMRIHTPLHGVTILYDGYRVEIQASSQYKGKIRGLCGTFDGEKVTDFSSPQNCILQNPLLFVASYSITDGVCQLPENKRKGLSLPCYKKV